MNETPANDARSAGDDLFAPLRAVAPPMSLSDLQIASSRHRSGSRFRPGQWLWVGTGLAVATAVVMMHGIGPSTAQRESSSSRLVQRPAVSAGGLGRPMKPGLSPGTMHDAPEGGEASTGDASGRVMASAMDRSISRMPSRARRQASSDRRDTTAEIASHAVAAPEEPAVLPVVPREPSMLARSVPDRPIADAPPSPDLIPPGLMGPRAAERLYVGLQMGTILGALNTLGGGASVTASHDWMQGTFRYTSTFGTTGTELFAQPRGKSGSQNVREIVLMAGGRLEQGDFWASIEGGINIIHASFTTIYDGTKPDTLSNDIGGSWGGSAQATFGYRINDNLGISLTGFASNHSITYGGLLISIVGGQLK